MTANEFLIASKHHSMRSICVEKCAYDHTLEQRENCKGKVNWLAERLVTVPRTYCAKVSFETWLVERPHRVTFRNVRKKDSRTAHRDIQHQPQKSQNIPRISLNGVVLALGSVGFP
jgi:hypothetical protein